MKSLRWLFPALLLAALVCAPGAQAIVAGSQVPITNHPYQARVVMTAPSGQYSCGGVIYDSTHIVTAAHCMYIDDTLLAPANVRVGYASADINALSAANVSEVTIPSAYLDDDSYDVAVVQLTAPLNNFGTASVGAIPLATGATLATGVGAESNAFATGWGNTTENGSSPRYLRGVALPLRADSVCATFAAYASSYQGARSVCAGGKGATANSPDTCQGDSGGPLALDSGSGYKLVGLTSNGLGCGRALTPAVYTETSNSEIEDVIDGSAPASSTLRGSQFAPPSNGGDSGAPAVTTPVSQAPAPPAPGVATRDTQRPTTRVSKLSCTKKRRCSFRLAAADRGGTVTKLSAKITRKVRKCRTRGTSRVCSTSTRTKKVKPKRVTGGFTFSASLAKASYKLTAVATDASGNRSATLSRTFRVR